MKLKIIQTRNFSKAINGFMRKRLLLREDFYLFQRNLVASPGLGVMIVGTGGIRKVRLKTSSQGKSGGFRVCYYFLLGKELYLLLIYAKNEQENLTMGQKKELRALVKMLKGAKNE